MNCPNCGQAAKGKFCTNCGQRLNPAPVTRSSSDPGERTIAFRPEELQQQLKQEGSAPAPAFDPTEARTVTVRQEDVQARAEEEAARVRAEQQASVPADPTARTFEPHEITRGDRPEAAPSLLVSAEKSEMDLRPWIIVPAMMSTFFGLGHHLEHYIRHDTGFPLTSTPSPWTFALIIYPIAIPGIIAAFRGRLLPALWLVVALPPIFFVALAHLSPIALDPLSKVYNYYGNHVAGVIADADVILLLVSLILLAISAVRVHNLIHRWW